MTGLSGALEVDDCGFRMLEPHEIARAMVMNAHIDGRPYIVHGTKRDQVKQYGNAVTPPVMARILAQVADRGERAHVQFCGAGGETLGATAAGVVPILAMNHWKVAIESHAANFPDTEHLLADVVCLDPRAYPGAEILLTSPECREHSYAKGRPKNDPSLFGPDESAQRSRATMWDVPRFAEAHRYRLIVVENVVQVVNWCEARKNRHGWDPVRREWRCSCGHDFQRWLGMMDTLGYDHAFVSFNSMFAPPTPQSRDRLYTTFWLRGQQPNLELPVLGWCPSCERMVDGHQAWKKVARDGRPQVGRYGQQYVYRCSCGAIVFPAVTPAASAIDFSLPAPRIGDREKPLAPASRSRIERGLPLLVERPLIVAVGGNLFERPGYTRAWPVEQPMKTVVGTFDRALVLSNMAHGVAKRADEPAHTVTTGNKLYLVDAPDAALVSKNEGSVPRTVAEPAHTVTAIPQLYLLQLPGGLVVPLRNGADPVSVRVDNPGGWTRSTDEPIGTITGTDGHALVVPYRQGVGRPADEPLPTATTVDPYALVVRPEKGGGRSV